MWWVRLRCEMLCSVAGFLGVFRVLQGAADFDEMWDVGVHVSVDFGLRELVSLHHVSVGKTVCWLLWFAICWFWSVFQDNSFFIFSLLILDLDFFAYRHGRLSSAWSFCWWFTDDSMMILFHIEVLIWLSVEWSSLSILKCRCGWVVASFILKCWCGCQWVLFMFVIVWFFKKLAWNDIALLVLNESRLKRCQKDSCGVCIWLKNKKAWQNEFQVHDADGNSVGTWLIDNGKQKCQRRWR